MVSISHLYTDIDGHQAILLTAMLDGQLVGTATVRDLLGAPFLASVYVEPSYQRCGIAAAMIQRALLLVQATGTHALGLTVRDDNQAAVACYEALGFRRYQAAADMPGFSNYGYWYARN